MASSDLTLRLARSMASFNTAVTIALLLALAKVRLKRSLMSLGTLKFHGCHSGVQLLNILTTMRWELAPVKMAALVAADRFRREGVEVWRTTRFNAHAL